MALPITTQRAAHAAAHPLHLIEEETAPRHADTASVVPLVGCMTGASNTISEQLARIDMPPKVTRFLRCLERATFGWAGVHRTQGHAQPGTWCWFALTEWVERTAMSRSQILHLRQRLVEDGLIWYEPDETTHGRGRIGWNLNFAAWKPLQPGYRRWGGTRPGAGRPRKPESAAGVVNLKKGNEATPRGDLSARSTPEDNSSLQFAEPVEKSSLQQVSKSSLQLQVGAQEIKMTTPAPAQTTQGTPSAQTLRRKLRKKITETPIVVSEGQRPSPAAQPGTADQDGVLSGAASPGEPAMSSHKQDEALSKAGASAPQSTRQEVCWPPRQDWEKSDLDYYQRVLREREKERVALLTRLAHEHIGVPLEKASYVRIGALAKQCGASLVVKHILLATANHIDGDPLDYLTKLARGQQKKETPHATRSTAPASGYQPYNAEEASQLVWNTL